MISHSRMLCVVLKSKMRLKVETTACYGLRPFWVWPSDGEAAHGGKRRLGEGVHHLSAEKTDKQLKTAYPNAEGESRRAMMKLTVNGTELGMRTSQDFGGTKDGTQLSIHCGHCRWLACLCFDWNGLFETAIACRGALRVVRQMEAQWLECCLTLLNP